MRNLLLLALIFCGLGLAQPALVVEVRSNTQTTSSIDTSAAGSDNLIVISVSAQDSAPTVSDTKGNSYGAAYLNQVSNDASNRVFMFYCLACTIGTSHAFTTSAGSGVHDIVVQVFSGVAGLDTGIFSSGFNSSGQTAQPGSITPSVDGDLLVVAAACGSGSYPDNNSFGWDITDFAVVNGNGLSFLVQTTAAAINPTVHFVSGGTFGAVALAAFKASSVIAPARVPHHVSTN